MNDKIKAAAKRMFQNSYLPELKIASFIDGAEYFRKESGVEELREAVKFFIIQSGIVAGEGYDVLRAALSKSDLFFNDKNLKDG